MKKKSNYYHVEIPVEAAKILAYACDAMGSILAGDVNALRDVVLRAYAMRMDRGASSEVEAEIGRLSRELIAIGWDTNVTSGYMHRFSAESDTMFDVSEVLEQGLAINGDIDDVPTVPEHWNKDIELCQVLVVTTSRKKKNRL